MQRAGEPQTEGRENLADVLGHRCDNPGSGQQAIEQERPKHHVAKRARDEGSAGILSRDWCRWRNDIPRGSCGYNRVAGIGWERRFPDGHKHAVYYYRKLMMRRRKWAASHKYEERQQDGHWL
jgi:hypothetical protein